MIFLSMIVEAGLASIYAFECVAAKSGLAGFGVKPTSEYAAKGRMVVVFRYFFSMKLQL
jgi:hypothetical protein